MYSAWTAHLTDKEKENFKDRLIRNKDLFDRMSEIMDMELNSMETVELSPKAFETPSWSHKQAFFNGYKACIKTLNKLTDLRKDQT
mgnify:CR=1 FL=1